MSLSGVILNRAYVFLQARIGSQRLPGKVLKLINGRPMIAYVIDRLRLIQQMPEIVLLTSSKAQDDELARWCDCQKVLFFRGSEENVLERYFQAAQVFPADHYIRATGDNPLVDPYFAGELLASHVQNENDYSSNKSEVGSHLPDGFGVEIFSRPCLSEVYRRSTSPAHFEHVNEYVLENPSLFRINYQRHESLIPDWSSIRMTVDTPQDFERAERILTHPQYQPELRINELMKLL